MNNTRTYNLNIPDGYTIAEKCITMPLDAAVRLLKTKRQHRYTSALRAGNNAVLTRHIFTCPHCRRSSPAYVRFFSTGEYLRSRIPREVIDDWYAPQISMFDEETTFLELNRALTSENRWDYTCPRCGAQSSLGTASFSVQLRSDGETVSLSHITFSPEALLFLPSNEADTNVSFFSPLTESIFFDFLSGKTFFRITDKADVLLYEEDVLSASNVWKDTLLYKLIQNNTLVQRRLRHLFSAQMHTAFPFSKAECTPEHFAVVVRFQGYPRSFYDAIPCISKTGELDESFGEASAALKRADTLPATYNSSGLPRMKSIRKIFFANPGLFFYLAEAAALWDVIKDPNFFRVIFSLPRIYEILAFLHQFPGSMIFFADYAGRESVKALVSLLTDFTGTAKLLAIRYAAMNPIVRKTESFAFEEDDEMPEPQVSLAYSHPIHTKRTADIADSIVNGYRFVRLRTSRDYALVGKELHNCLDELYPAIHPIFAIKKESLIQGVIEIRNDLIIQARVFNNAHIESCPHIYAAFKKWARHNSLRTIEEILDELPEDELPL